MARAIRPGTIGLTAGAILFLAACGQGSSRSGEAAATPTLWQLPPAFTATRTATGTSALTPEVSNTPTLGPTQKPTLTKSPLAAGGNHTCAVTAEGGVMCWGSNGNGQLGDGSRTDRTKPVNVKNLSSPAVAVVAGWEHTCALDETGAVQCWGRNKEGELGNGGTQRSSEPVAVEGLGSRAVALAAGDYHTCAVTAEGGVKCWGQNDQGQLGDGTTKPQNVPVDVQGLTAGATAVAAGTRHTCVVSGTGGVLCWGANDLAQLGDGSNADFRGKPAPVEGLSGGVAELTAKGGHTCVRDGSGTVFCWGENKYGQLGDGTNDNLSTPAPVIGLGEPAARIAAGWRQTCAALVDGSLKCWGWNFYGQLGEGSTANRNKPVSVQGLKGKAVTVAGGYGHTCVILESGEIYCWGLNQDGQLGNRTNLDSPVPVKVIGIPLVGEK
jgi:alpha-tubulin suppressor-like RCC1 family protein